MNTCRSTLPRFLAAVLLAGLATTAAADPPATAGAAPAGAHRPVARAGRELAFRLVLKQLNLSPEQQTQVDGIVAGARPQFEAQRTRAHANRAALASTAPGDPRYPTLVAAVQSDAAAGIQLASDFKTQVYALLTPEQQARIPAIQAADQAQRAQRRAARQNARGAPDPQPAGVQ